jgi:biopolymer transport protein ExbB
LFPLANIATLIGLIGTISGLIKCFSALSAASAAEKQTVLSRGISEAMYNTAFGLMIAVTCIAAQLWLATKAKHVLEEVEFNALKLENLLARRLAGDLEPEKAA